MLELRDVHAYYGESHILHGMTLRVDTGDVATLVGRNGVGKTTTLRTIMGIVAPRRGAIELDGTPIAGLPSDRIAKRGLGYVPEERGILATLSVYENLTLAPIVGDKGWTVDRIFAEFPNLKERAKAAGTTLSGGEQQMLAIARVLRSGARTVLLDEPTEGLAPVIIQQIGHTIARLKKEGFTILLVEQNFRFAATVADRYYIVEHGKIIDGFANADLQANMHKLHTYLGV